jgi:hypothetical protein
MPLSTLRGLASARRPLALGALLLASLSRPGALAAQPAAPAFDLSVANIMRGPEHYGWEPQQVRWTADGQWLYFRWVAAGSAWDTPMSWYRVRPAAGATPERVDDVHADSIAPYIATGPVTRDGRTRAVSANGDLWLIDTRRGSARRLTETVAGEADPRFSADERHLLFLREGNAYALELATGATRQLTDVRAGTAPRDSARAAGQRGALVQDQLDLLQVIRDRARIDSTARASRDAAAARRLPVLYAPAGERIASVSVSPNLQVAVMLTTAAGTGARTADVPNYVTSSGYSEMIPTRSKVGDAQSRTRAWRVDLASGALTAIPVIGTDTTQRAASVQVSGWRDDGSMALLFTTSRISSRGTWCRCLRVARRW